MLGAKGLPCARTPKPWTSYNTGDLGLRGYHAPGVGWRGARQPISSRPATPYQPRPRTGVRGSDRCRVPRLCAGFGWAGCGGCRRPDHRDRGTLVRPALACTVREVFLALGVGAGEQPTPRGKSGAVSTRDARSPRSTLRSRAGFGQVPCAAFVCRVWMGVCSALACGVRIRGTRCSPMAWWAVSGTCSLRRFAAVSCRWVRAAYGVALA